MQKLLNNILLILTVFSIGISSYAQQSYIITDIENIRDSLSQKPDDPYKRPYIYNNEPSLIKKFNPVSMMLGGTFYIYQNIFSKHISAYCLFTPSCSEFSKQAIREEGLLKGTIMSIDRVNRCNRIAAQDLKHYNLDAITNRYPDPIMKYQKE